MILAELVTELLEAVLGLQAAFDPVDVQHAVEVIDLVLEDAGVEAGDLQPTGGSLGHPMLHHHGAIATDQPADIGHGQAALVVEGQVVAALNDAGVDEELDAWRFGSGSNHHDDRTGADAQLRCGQADATVAGLQGRTQTGFEPVDVRGIRAGERAGEVPKHAVVAGCVLHDCGRGLGCREDRQILLREPGGQGLGARFVGCGGRRRGRGWRG